MSKSNSGCFTQIIKLLIIIILGGFILYWLIVFIGYGSIMLS